MSVKKERHLTVCTRNTVDYRSGLWLTKYREYPEIRMTGRWLEELGFHSGDKVKVDCSTEGKITISREE
jgi:hypothetical protein